MKMLRLALLLAGLPLLPGCLTYETLDAAKNPSPRILNEDRARVVKATISKDDQLLIFLKGSITNSPKDSLYTLAIPLTEIETKAGAYLSNVWSPIGTNEIYGANLNVLRDSLHAGWPEINSDDVETVPVGPPISSEYLYPNSFIGKLPKTAKLLTNTPRSLYQVPQDGYLEFIYIDALYRRAYTDLQLDDARDSSRRTAFGFYLLLPVTVPLDIATSPIQIPFFILVGENLGHQ